MTNLPDLQTFIATVDKTSAKINREISTENLRSYIGLSPGSNYSLTAASDAFQGKIRGAFSAGHRSAYRHCAELRKHLIHHHVANGAPLDPYFEIISSIQDAMRGDNPADAIGDWSVAIQWARDHQAWRGRDIHRPNYETVFRADIERAGAAKRLAGYGLNSPEVPYELSPERDSSIAKSIAKRVQNMGGIEVAARLFARLRLDYCAAQGRYHFVNRFGLGGSMLEPRLPAAFLLQLAAKYPQGKKPLRRSDEDWAALLQISTDYAILHSVQPRTNMNWIAVDPLLLLQFMREIAVHDGLYTLQQLRPSDVLTILHGILNSLCRRQFINHSNNASLLSTLQVIEGIQHIVGARHGPVTMMLSEIIAACSGMSELAVTQALEGVLAHPRQGANQRFTSVTEVPDDSVPREDRIGADFGGRPLLRTDSKTYVMLGHSVCAPAFVEAVLTQLRSVGVKEEIGHAVEDLLMQEFESRDVAAHSGDYVIPSGKAGECDLVIETKSQVIFLEAKAKALTRIARSGRDLELLIDMSKSMLKATIQSGWHELHLRKHQALELSTIKGRYVVDLQDRAIERIAVSLLDYGGFQDRIVIEQILHGQLASTYGANNPAFEKSIADVNKLGNELRLLNEELYDVRGKPERWRPFFNCWFLSVPQVLLLLDGVFGADQFADELRRTRSFTMGTRDFYYEYAYTKRMAAAKK